MSLVAVAMLLLACGLAEGTPYARHLLQQSQSACALCCGAEPDAPTNTTAQGFCTQAYRNTPGVCCGTVRTQYKRE